MPWVKKVKEDWVSKERPNFPVGSVVFVTNAETLIKEGKAVYVDEQRNELSRGSINGEKTMCPICVFTTNDAHELADHIYREHPRKGTKDAIKPEIAVAPRGKKFKDMTDEEKKAWRIVNLKKAREAAFAKREATRTKEVVKTIIESKDAKN
jgi:hypothetical protein